jgi:hypothetical protein
LTDDSFGQLHNYLRQSGKILSGSESTDAEALIALVNSVSNRLINASGLRHRFQWEIMVVKASEANAMVMPNGKILVFTGILPVAKNEAGLAAVLGHEIGHVMARHSAERLSQVLLGRIALRAISQAAARSKYRSVIATAAGFGIQYGVLLPFSREHELEADRIGLILMAKAGYEPSEAIEVWKRMEERNVVRPWEFFSSHPNPTTRQAQLREWLPEANTYYADASRALPGDLMIVHARTPSDTQTRVLPIALRPSLAPGYWWRFQRSNEKTSSLRRFDRREPCAVGECIVMVDDEGTTSFVNDTYESLVETRTAKGVSRMNPPLKLLSWPLSVGATWSQPVRLEGVDGRVTQLTTRMEVVSYEAVDTPAGSFMSFKIVASANGAKFREYWYSPEVRTVVRTWERTDASGVVTTQLLDYQRSDEPVVNTAKTETLILPMGFTAPVAAESPFETKTSTAPSILTTPPKPTPAVKALPNPPQVTAPVIVIRERLLSQLYLIRGPIVSNPPQAFRGTFLPDGKAEIILSGNRRLVGNFESFPVSESIQAKYKPALIKPDNLKIPRGADVKGFAALSDGVGTDIECVFLLNSSTTRGEGTCADNQRNTYRIVFD